MAKYRKDYQEKYGDIPKGYHLHHMTQGKDRDDPENLLCVSRDMHRQIHEALFLRYGKKRDALAAIMLGGKNHSTWKLTEEHKEKLRGPRDKFSEITKQRMSESKTGYKYKTVECPHCGKTGGASAMGQWHFNNCKNYG